MELRREHARARDENQVIDADHRVPDAGKKSFQRSGRKGVIHGVMGVGWRHCRRKDQRKTEEPPDIPAHIAIPFPIPF